MRWRIDYAAPTGRTGELFHYNLSEIQAHTDRLFFYLLLLQYVAAISLALTQSPIIWPGTDSHIHFHVWLAVLFGGLVTSLPMYLIRKAPAHELTRQTIAVAQMLMGALLIHLTGGRIATHFHLFGSLAFLGFYRDARVLATATIIAALDQCVRGALIPLSVYGTTESSQWRMAEHIFWILFEDVFLLLACSHSRAQLSAMAGQQAQLEQINGQIEEAVRARTRELSLRTDELSAARDAAIESTRLKSHFLANVSHEIRTPMNGVLGMTSILLDSDLTADQRDCALTVQRSAEGLLTIINDILDFSKIEAGKLSIERVDFDLLTEIEDALGLLGEAASRKELELISDLASDLPHVVAADPGRLRQVLVNLTANAIKFTESGEVCVRVTEVGREGTRSRLRFEVVDTGIGIPETEGKKLFQSFMQVDGSSTRKFEGTGLGLAISKELVELMGGQIGFRSTPGVGTVFWFEIIVEVRSDQAPDDKLHGLRGRRALVVEGNATQGQALVRTLEHWGVSTHLAQAGQEGISLIRSEEFDLFLLDHRAQGINLLLKELRQRNQAHRIIVLAAIGQRTVQGFGGVIFVAKPVRRRHLMVALARACGHGPPTFIDATPRRATTPTLDVSLRILVAEDNMVNQRVLMRMLERLGQQCDVVADGAEATAAAIRKRYDVILMDCQMPRVDGYEASAIIRRTSDVPIIAVTADAMAGTRERCAAAGMNHLIAKPIRLRELAQVLRIVCPHSVAEKRTALAQFEPDGDLLPITPAVDTAPAWTSFGRLDSAGASPATRACDLAPEPG